MNRGPDRVLRGATRLLPAGREEWGRAMRAELAALDRGRWSFALSCTRGVVSRSATLARLVRAGGLAVIATEVLVFVAQGRTDITLIAVWTTLLAIYTLALLRVTARGSTVTTGTLATGAAFGVLAALGWVTAAALHPSLPSSDGPAVVAIAAAAAAGAAWAGRGAQAQIAGLCAAAGCALLVAVMIDGPLRLFPGWVANSAPPVSPPESVDRLVDSIGVWMLGCLLAAALTLAIRSASVSGDPRTPSRGPAPARHAS
jgi:hypothetical protein